MLTSALRLAAALLLALPLAAQADPITITVALAPYIGGTLAAFVAANALTLISIGITVYGAAASRRKARSAASRSRAEANARLEDRAITLLQGTPPWRIVYGRCIVGGDIVAIFTTDKLGYRDDGSTYTKPDALKHLVIVVAAHEVQAINEIYIEGQALGTLDGSGWVTGGDFYTTSKPVSRTVSIAGSGSLSVPEAVVTILHAYYTTGTGVDVVYTDVTPTLSVGNTLITNPSANAIEVVYTIANASGQKGSVRVSKHLGADTQTVDTYLNGVAPTQWTSAHRLRGLAYVVVTLDLEEPRFQGGPPQMTFDVTGRKVYDPRTGLTAWSENPALIVRDWLTSAWGFECEAEDIDDAACIVAANACEVPISLTVGGVTTTGQPTYTCNGAFTTDDSREAVLEDLVECMAGFATYGAAWSINAGAWTPPVMDLTDDDLDGQIEIVQAGAGLDTLFNGIRGTYIPSGKAAPTDFAPPYQNAAFLAADGRELWQDIALPFTDNPARARNLARVFTERNRDGQVIKYPAKLRAWPLQVGDRVTVTSGEYGFEAKTYRVTDWQFGLSTAVELTLQEDIAAIYDLADAADADPAPNTALPDPWVVAALTGYAATSTAGTALKSGSSPLVPRVLVTWAAVTDAYVVAAPGRIEILWKRPNGAWNQVNVPGDSTSIYLVGMNHLDRIVIELRARNGLGKVGTSVFINHTVSGAAVVKTNEVGAGEITDQVTVTAAGPVSAISANTELIRVNVGPYTVATDVQIVATVQLEATWGTTGPPQFYSDQYINLSSGADSPTVRSDVWYDTNAHSAVITLGHTMSLAANTSGWARVMGNVTVSGGGSPVGRYKAMSARATVFKR